MTEPTIVCKYCNVAFAPKTTHQRFCSLKCRKLNNRHNPAPIVSKVCKTCGVDKSPEMFFVTFQHKDGRDTVCKDCRNPAIVAKNSTPERRALNRERVYAHRTTERGKQQRKEHHRRAAQRRAETRGKTYIPRDERPLPDPFKHAERDAVKAWKEWLYNSAPSQWLDRYFATEPWKDHRIKNVERQRLRYRLDAEYNLNERLRAQEKKKRRKKGVDGYRLRVAIKNDLRMPSLPKRCGYTISQLKIHLERQFTKGMNWDRFCAGDIDIDHIIPLVKFNLVDDVHHAWALTNLRPMWPIDNYKKGARVQNLL